MTATKTYAAKARRSNVAASAAAESAAAKLAQIQALMESLNDDIAAAGIGGCALRKAVHADLMVMDDLV